MKRLPSSPLSQGASDKKMKVSQNEVSHAIGKWSLNIEVINPGYICKCFHVQWVTSALTYVTLCMLINGLPVSLGADPDWAGGLQDNEKEWNSPAGFNWNCEATGLCHWLWKCHQSARGESSLSHRNPLRVDGKSWGQLYMHNCFVVIYSHVNHLEVHFLHTFATHFNGRRYIKYSDINFIFCWSYLEKTGVL